MSHAVDTVLRALEAHECNPRRTHRGWRAHCPVHEDRDPSLFLDPCDDGALLICRAGCSTEEIVGVLGLEWADLFDDRTRHSQRRPISPPARRSKPPPDPLPPPEQVQEWERALRENPRLLGRLQEVRGIAPEVVAELPMGFDEKDPQYPITIHVPDVTGELVNVIRWHPKPEARPEGRPKMLAIRGRERQLWPRPEAVASNERPVLFVEGETDVPAGWTLGFPTIGAPGSCKWDDAWPERLRKFPRVGVCGDDDEAGRQFIERAAAALADADVEAIPIDLSAVSNGKEKFDLTDLLLRDGPEKARAFVEEALKSSVGSVADWPEPQPLPGGAARPTFPTEALPQAVRDWVEATAEATQTPVDLAAGMALAVTATAALGWTVEAARGWDEELALFLACVLPSAERKSEIKRRAVEPLRTIERECVEAAKPLIRETRAKRDALDAEYQRLTRDAGKGKATHEELAEVSERLADVGETVEPRLFADDATPEALARLLADHGRLGIISAESAVLDNLAGRYAERGRPNLHLVCQAYSGESVRVDRRGRDPEYIDRPLLTIGLCIQPHVLNAMVEHEVMREQGLLGRFVFLLPMSRIGSRQIDPSPVPDSIVAGYYLALRQVAESCDRTDKTSEAGSSVGSVARSQGSKITLSAQARDVFRDMRTAHEPRLHPQLGDLARIASWANRHPGRVVRIAGLLHLLEGRSPSEPINAETMNAAVVIGDYLIAHACVALDPAGNWRMAQAVAWIRSTGAKSFTVRDLHRNAFGARDEVEPIADACAELADLGYLRKCPTPPPGPKGGRPPSPRYDVNPAVHSASRPLADDEERDVGSKSPNGRVWSDEDAEEAIERAKAKDLFEDRHPNMVDPA